MNESEFLNGGKVLLAVLAAGKASRMNASKLTLPFCGTTLLDHAIAAAKGSRADKVLVVTGSHRESVSEILNHYEGVDEAFNSKYAEGQASSVRVAVDQAEQGGYSALIIMVADQPFINSEDIDALITAAKKRSQEIIVTESAGKRGNPCLFRSSLYSSLGLLQGDEGARALIRATPDEEIFLLVSNNPLVHVDIDTPEDYVRFNA